MLYTHSLPPRFTSSDFVYITLALILGFGLGTRVVEQAPRVSQAQAAGTVYAAVLPGPEPATDRRDPRIIRLEKFLESKLSPLAPYAALIVSEADRYDIGWTKIVSISRMESDFGRNCPTGSYNAWGIGGSTFRYFTSWEDGIHGISELLGSHYKQNEYEAIKAKYCPAEDNCNPAWARIVHETTERILSMDK